MPAPQLYRCLCALLRRVRTAHGPVWLMVLLLAIPTSLASSSVSRMLASESEESCPLTETEEISEEARPETGGWELVNRSAAVVRKLPPDGASNRGPCLMPVAAVCAAERMALNGCGAILRC
jgi:hypothetical protein